MTSEIVLMKMISYIIKFFKNYVKNIFNYNTWYSMLGIIESINIMFKDTLLNCVNEVNIWHYSII